MLPFLYVKETGFIGITFKDFGFYLIDEKYLKYLHDIDEEVRYDEYRNYDRKPKTFINIRKRLLWFLSTIVILQNLKKPAMNMKARLIFA